MVNGLVRCLYSMQNKNIDDNGLAINSSKIIQFKQETLLLMLLSLYISTSENHVVITQNQRILLKLELSWHNSAGKNCQSFPG